MALGAGARDKKIKQQAADLALDTLVLLKQDELVEKWSGEFSQIFAQEKSVQEYRKIQRKSLFNQVAKLDGGKNQKDRLKAWQVLLRMNLSDATDQEKRDYYRNKLILAEKLTRFIDARESADKYLSLNGLSEEERQFAFAAQVLVGRDGI